MTTESAWNVRPVCVSSALPPTVYCLGVGQRLVGREAQLVEVNQFLGASDREFAVLALEGPAGIGKTTLWREARDQARERGALVLWCRPSEAEVKHSFAALGDMLSRLDIGAFASMPPLQREALEVALGRRPAAAARPVAQTTAPAFLALVRNLAMTGAVLLAVDDCQWLDPPSSRVFEFAARRLEDERIGLLYSIRSPAVGLPAGVVADERMTRLKVEPLSLAALGRILADRVGRPLPRPYLLRIARASGGNPFYALEIAQAAAETGFSQASGSAFVPVPEDLRKLTAARIRRLPPATREAVLLAAVVSGPDRRSIDLDQLSPAEEAGIVTVDDSGQIMFTHPLFAAAAYRSVSTARRHGLHRRAAEVVTGHEERARHLALAAAGPDPDVAAQLEQGAATAAARGASDAAAELSELAARLTPENDPNAGSLRLLAAARYQFDAGDLARAEELVQTLLVESTEAALRCRTLQLASDLAARRSNFAYAMQLATEALELAEGDRELRAAIELHLVYCAVSAGDFGGADVYARAAVADAEALGEDAMLADTLAVLTMAEFLSGRGVDKPRLDRALALEDPAMARSFIMRPKLIDGMLRLDRRSRPGSRGPRGDPRRRGRARGRGRFSDALALSGVGVRVAGRAWIGVGLCR